MLGHGFRLNQVDLVSMATLPPRERLVRLRDEVRARTSDDYECLTILGPTPPELLEAAALLRVHMSTDEPVGEVEYQPEAWDAQRVVDRDAALERADRQQLQTLVRHVASGELVGFPRLFKDRRVDAIAHQWETLVIKGHRGHGLGMLAKVTNQAAVAEHWPTVRRIETGNATENLHMLAINNALGYEPYAAIGFWAMTDGPQS